MATIKSSGTIYRCHFCGNERIVHLEHNNSRVEVEDIEIERQNKFRREYNYPNDYMLEPECMCDVCLTKRSDFDDIITNSNLCSTFEYISRYVNTLYDNLEAITKQCYMQEFTKVVQKIDLTEYDPSILTILENEKNFSEKRKRKIIKRFFNDHFVDFYNFVHTCIDTSEVFANVTFVQNEVSKVTDMIKTQILDKWVDNAYVILPCESSDETYYNDILSNLPNRATPNPQSPKKPAMFWYFEIKRERLQLETYDLDLFDYFFAYRKSVTERDVYTALSTKILDLIQTIRKP